MSEELRDKGLAPYDAPVITQIGEAVKATEGSKTTFSDSGGHSGYLND